MSCFFGWASYCNWKEDRVEVVNTGENAVSVCQRETVPREQHQSKSPP